MKETLAQSEFACSLCKGILPPEGIIMRVSGFVCVREGKRNSDLLHHPFTSPASLKLPQNYVELSIQQVLAFVKKNKILVSTALNEIIFK